MEKFEFTKQFGASVKRRRRQLGLSQESLAERADLHRTYVCDVERGARNLSLQSIAKLAQALETSVAALFPGAGLNDGTPATACVDILLVEDNPHDVELTLQAFKKARFMNRVRVVGDGAEALDYIFHQGKYAESAEWKNPFVLLLDLHLPKVSGMEVLRRIRQEAHTKEIPTIVLTASSKGTDIAESQRLGAVTHIVKPVNFQKLIDVTPLLKLNWALLKQIGDKSRAGKE